MHFLNGMDEIRGDAEMLEIKERYDSRGEVRVNFNLKIFQMNLTTAPLSENSKKSFVFQIF